MNRANLPAVVAAIGMFDGVHLGHQAILQKTRAEAKRRGARAAALTFDPHPSVVLVPGRAAAMIQTAKERAAALRGYGMDDVFVLRFTRRLAEDLRAAEEEKLAATESVRERVARLLLLLADRYGEETARHKGLTVQLPMARQDMAALLGVRAESVARAIRALEDDGVARFRGRKVTIPSIERLMAELRGGY